MSIKRNLLGSPSLTSQPGSDPSIAASRSASESPGEDGIQETTTTPGSVPAPDQSVCAGHLSALGGEESSSPFESDSGSICPKCELAAGKECPGCLTNFCRQHLIECPECPELMCSDCLSAHTAEGHWSDFRTSCEQAQSTGREQARPVNHALEHGWRIERLRQHVITGATRAGNAAAAQQLQSCIYVASQCAGCGEWRLGLPSPPQGAEVACPVCAQPCAFTLLGWGLTSRALPFHEQFIAKEAFDPEGGRRIPWDELPLVRERQLTPERQEED